MPRVCLHFVIVIFPDHTHLLILIQIRTDICHDMGQNCSKSYRQTTKVVARKELSFEYYFNPGKCGKIYMPMFHKPLPFLPFICQEVYIQIPGFVLELCHKCTLQLNKNTDTICNSENTDLHR